ncbi:MAG: hypothetical protein OES84_00245 [Kiritimatiellaceae bacterium]|nr:hypothetical protein [Kiritimatiellaceae bacterium]
MSEKDLKLEPHNVTENLWWYEENAGVLIVFEGKNGPEQAIISWRSLRNALERKDK